MLDSDVVAPAAFYDTDAGHKKTIERTVSTSPRMYSIVRSKAPRFGYEPRTQSVPCGTYSQDTAHKKTIASAARDGRRFYAATFRSTAPRFGRPWTAPVTDALYDIHKTCNCSPATISLSLQTTPQTYSILRSTYPRLTTRLHTEGPDVLYDTEYGRKASMYTAMVASPRLYRNVGALPTALTSCTTKPGTARSSDQGRSLGPGSYDFKTAKGLSVSPSLDARPLSSMMSRSPRFGRVKGELNLGSTWEQGKDEAAWQRKGAKISATKYLRPQYLPKACEQMDAQRPATVPAGGSRNK